MKKQQVKISNQDEFNKRLQRTSPATWIILGAVVALLVSFFVWASVFKFPIRLTGKVDIYGGEAILHVSDSDLDKLKAGQKIYINDKEGEILSIQDDKQPVVSNFPLEDGEYTYTLVIKEMRPIEFLFGS